MERKKSKKASLENKRGLFLMIGLALTLFIVWRAFEYKVDVSKQEVLQDVKEELVEEEHVPITRQDEVKPPPPPPPVPRMSTILDIVDNEEEIEDELEIRDSEVTEEEDVEIKQVVEEEEVEDEHQIFVKVENMPIFNYPHNKTHEEGQVALNRYINQAIKYPVLAQENGISGKVFVKFVVGLKGEIENVEILRTVDPSLDKEAERVIRNLPKFKPGNQRGRPARVNFTVMVNFQLQ